MAPTHNTVVVHFQRQILAYANAHAKTLDRVFILKILECSGDGKKQFVMPFDIIAAVFEFEKLCFKSKNSLNLAYT